MNKIKKDYKILPIPIYSNELDQYPESTILIFFNNIIILYFS